MEFSSDNSLLGFVIFYTVLAWFTFLLRCKHFSGFWYPRYAHTYYPLKYVMHFSIANSAFNIFTDVCFATLPIPIVWNLQMSSRMKTSLIAVLSLGYINNNVRFWGFIQLNVGIIAASIPTLKPLLRKISNSTNSNQYNQFQDGDKARTIGSGPPSRPRRSILTTLSGTRTDRRADTEAYEMWRATAGSAQGGKNEIYAVSEERAGSEDHIVGGNPPGSKQIKCTTEVVISNEGADSRV
ncbi:hypothetical protein BKA58DRAFT_440014 [Alternaria rosae]|uniref:uncharacterized protein n=1 Tax=Alternaria rosae TaxID=1187941 RepID=UPI001E8E984C|nr:uncharacterized protein BKA58DRAFT_440014 [Alternaria rosae]KAH6870466.1 hypothetical protein BKA58DRAFT_440014 [Alternaria rosae]